ncbi:MAG: relaxase/mobilization nuclease domain-containing protein [Sphingobacteriales bacterium]|nr:relaxase/mobilization nuclease domain-containing protein [Sphingobacteriales bacterium]MBI3717590.1 relaxase/mobilization nuclease domain-containing protein [Sphingobacteriales bacterium]
MVAVIKTGHSIHRIVNYNENKAKEGVAKCISAANYPKDADKLSLKNKLNRLLNQASLNTNVSRNSVHVSLNFDPSENHSKEKLETIANTYMERIGFGNQPYLVYQHHDAGHPHIHIVSIKVREDGSRIDTQNIGKNQSEKARKEIEKEFGLMKAEDSKRLKQYQLKPLNAEKIQYGKSETKRGILNVLNEVLFNYKYASIPELNAVLKQFNVMADRGSENSRVYKNNGLAYRLLDEKGNRVGVPIKASDFFNKPTLKFLEERFVLNEEERQPHKARVKNTIDLVLIKQPDIGLQDLVKALEKESIQTMLRQNQQGIIYGITYIDHRTKSVFNGSALGKPYSANGIQERCSSTASSVEVIDNKKRAGEEKNKAEKQTAFQPLEKEKSVSDNNLLDVLINPKEGIDYVPWQLKKSKRKKRKGISR